MPIELSTLSELAELSMDGDEIIPALDSGGNPVSLKSSSIAKRVKPSEQTQASFINGRETITVQGEDGELYQIPLLFITPYADHRGLRPFSGAQRWPGRKTFSLFEQAQGAWNSVGAGTRTWETTDPFYGSEFQRVVTDGLGGTSIIRLNDTGVTYDATNKHISFTMKIDDISLISGIRLDIGDSSFSNYFRFNNILGSQSVRPVQDGQFVEYTFTLSNPDVVVGTPDRATINCFQLRFTDTGVSSATIELERIFFFDATPAVSCVTMDDGYSSWYTLGKPLLDEYDILTTMYCIQRYHDPNHPNYDTLLTGRLTEAQIQRMVDQGHELAYHEIGNDLTGNDPEGNPWTAELIRDSILNFKKWAWNTFGVEITTGAYPGGETREITASPGITVRDVFSDYLPTARTINRSSPETLPPGDQTLTKCYGYVFGNGTSKMTLTEAQSRISEVQTYGGVISWSFHELVTNTVSETDPSTWFNLTEFEAILNEIKTSDIPVATMQEVYSANYGQ